tara:strand:- start:140 stop:388 length:249 start_codon:yes stop_codon:yes gene_type:complete
MFENRKYVIITLADYTDSQIQEMIQSSIQLSKDTLRKSIDNTKAVLKWNGNTPKIFENIQTYTHSEILNVLTTSEWNVPIEE